MKICNCCNAEKDLEEFHKNSKFKDGLNNICKYCQKIKSKEYYNKNREKVKLGVSNYRNNNLEKVNNFVKENYNKNRESLLEYKKIYYIKNRDEMLRMSKDYYEKNKKAIHEKSKLYISYKRKTDPLYKLKDSIRTLILRSLKSDGYIKSKKTESILGCNISEFKIFIENKFIDGMTWENHGKWHLDHIIPTSWGNNESEILNLNHYSNFQPLWAKDNLSKGNRRSG